MSPTRESVACELRALLRDPAEGVRRMAAAIPRVEVPVALSETARAEAIDHQVAMQALPGYWAPPPGGLR